MQAALGKQLKTLLRSRRQVSDEFDSLLVACYLKRGSGWQGTHSAQPRRTRHLAASKLNEIMHAQMELLKNLVHIHALRVSREWLH
jgi:hypothetical protein